MRTRVAVAAVAGAAFVAALAVQPHPAPVREATDCVARGQFRVCVVYTPQAADGAAVDSLTVAYVDRCPYPLSELALCVRTVPHPRQEAR